MADKPSLRYDDFITSVQPDPAKPESTIMLSGFVGHGPEGQVRIYPDPTLGTWYDVPEDDVIHSLPIADSKLGGSFIWVRASAQIAPGSAAPAAAAQPQAAAAGIQPTPATHCFICPPLTQDCLRGAPQGAAMGVLPGGVPQTLDANCWTFMCSHGCDQTVGENCCTIRLEAQQGVAPQQPTPATHCFICPPNQTLPNLCTMVPACQPTPATICFVCPPITKDCTHQPACPPPTHAIHCPSQPVVCNTMPTPQTHCFICPPPLTHQLHCPTQPLVCNIQPTPSAVQHCGQAAAGVVPPTMNWCQPTLIGCAQAAAMQPGRMDTPACPTPECPTFQFWCYFTKIGCPPNGVFTPFGR